MLRNINEYSITTNSPLHKLKKLISEGLSKVRDVKGQDMVLVIGNTNAGKSTFINYMMGCKFKTDFKTGKKVLITIEESKKTGMKYPKIGFTCKAETFYPQAYLGANGFYYCDCPGFNENRGKEEKICVNLNTEFAVRLAKNIRGIIVVIDYHELTVARGKTFDELSKILGDLLLNPPALKKSICFVINKMPQDVLEHHLSKHKKPLVEMLNEKIDDLESKGKSYFGKFKSYIGIGKETNKREMELVHNQLKILHLMVESVDNMILLDMLDNGTCCKMVVNNLKKFTTIPKTQFNFNEYDSDRMEFNDYVYSVAHDGLKSISRTFEAEHLKGENTERINIIKQKIAHYQMAIEKLTETSNTGEMNESQTRRNIEESGKILASRLAKNHLLLKEQQEKISNKRADIDLCEKNLKELDTTELVKYWQDSIDKKIHWLNFLGYVHKYFRYVGEPYVKVTAKNEGGFFHGKKEDKENGKYSVQYETAFYENGQASVEILLHKRAVPENAKMIDVIKGQLSELKKELDTLEKGQEELNKENLQINGFILNLLKQEQKKEEVMKASYKLKLNELQSTQRRFAEEQRKLENELSAIEKELYGLNNYLKTNAELFKIMYEITSILGYKHSLLVQEFSKMYKKWRNPNIQMVKPILNDTTDVPTEFCCPITHDIMDDPVILQETSQTYERTAIEKWLLEKKTDPLTGKNLQNTSLISNIALRSTIKGFVQKRKQKALSSSSFISCWGKEVKKLDPKSMRASIKELNQHKVKLVSKLQKLFLEVENLKVEIAKVDSTISAFKKKLSNQQQISSDEADKNVQVVEIKGAQRL